MARVVLTNLIDVNDRIVNYYKSSDFKNPCSIKTNDFILTTFEKKRNPIRNIKRFDNGDFIAVIGTLIYDNKKKDQCLEELYNNFNHDDIVKFRGDIIGNYSILIRKNDEISIFTDRYNVIQLFYYNEGDSFALSNSCWHLAKSLSLKDINQVALLEEAMLISPVGRSTPFNDIKRLFGDTAIRISQNGKFLLKDLPVMDNYLNINHISFDDAVVKYSDLIKKEFSKICTAYSGMSFGLQQTGGLDNRTIFSALMNLGVKPRTFYGIGNTVLTNTKNSDLSIVHKYKDRFSLNLHIMNWNHDWENDKDNWHEQVLNYGFSHSLYGGSSNFFAEFENRIVDMPDFIECGYYGEVLRQREWAYQRKDSKPEGYTLNEFLNGYLFGPGYGGLHHDNFTRLFKEVRDKVSKDYEFELRKANLIERDKEGNLYFSIDNWSKLEWMHMRNCNSTTVNFLNDYTSSIAIFGTEKLHDFALNIPSRFLQNASFQLAVINKLFPDALEVPILTHGSAHKFNQFNFRLEKIDSQRSSVISKFKIIILHYLLKQPKFFNSLNNLRKTSKERNEELLIRKTFDSILFNNQDILSCTPKEYSGALVYYGVLAQYVNAIAMVVKVNKKNEI